MQSHDGQEGFTPLAVSVEHFAPFCHTVRYDSHASQKLYTYVTIRHADMYKLQSSKVETWYQAGLLLVGVSYLPSANQNQACLVQEFYLGRIKFLRVKRPYNTKCET